jgi:hypothetical protein
MLTKHFRSELFDDNGFFIFKSYVRSWHKSTHVQRYFFLEAYLNFLYFGYHVKVIWFSCRKFFFFFNYLTLSVPNEGTECHSRIVSTLLTLPEHLSSPPVFSGVRVTRSLVWCVCFVDRCLFFCTFSIGHCIVCSSLIYGFWLPLLYLQTLLDMHVFIATRIM